MNAITRQWDRFWEERLAKLILPDTLVGPERIHNLYVLAKRVEKEKVPGDVIECGVCNGGTAALLARFATRSRLNRTIWLLDSFQVMPVTTPEDGDAAKAHVGKEVGDVERVKAVLQRVGAEMSRVRIVSGWFQDTFPTVSASQIALLNIDADWYESVKLCLETFYDRVVRGGFISFDDYGHWPGCRKAVDEFFQARRLPYKLHQVDYTAQWFQKE
ncbi:MAG: TylF/MycF/NovP-related O-methyltransferase [Candidatus Acidiferrum sp.]